MYGNFLTRKSCNLFDEGKGVRAGENSEEGEMGNRFVDMNFKNREEE